MQSMTSWMEGKHPITEFSPRIEMFLSSQELIRKWVCLLFGTGKREVGHGHCGATPVLSKLSCLSFQDKPSTTLYSSLGTGVPIEGKDPWSGAEFYGHL